MRIRAVCVVIVVGLAAACAPPPPDGSPPVLTLPGDLAVQATSASGAAVDYVASATDAVDGPLPVACTPSSGTVFAPGTTVVSCSATDAAGNVATGQFTVTVEPMRPRPTAIAAGESHTCIVLEDGTVRCWGRNDVGQLGNGSTVNSSVPVPVAGLSGVVDIAAGPKHTCAAQADGRSKCWGRNDEGQLGNGTSTNSTVPVAVVGLTTVTAIAAGSGRSCAVLADGTARCWGTNGLGNGDGVNPSNVPVPVSGLTGAIDIDAGGHTCAVRTDGTARCWGFNQFGQLGNGTVLSGNLPVTVSGLTGAVAISAGASHTCARRTDGSARCWGYGIEGTLGNGVFSANSSTPVTVSGLTDAVSIDGGARHTCAALASGSARCWGGNGGIGLLGNGSFTGSSAVPVAVSGLDGATAVATGDSHTCATTNVGAVRCWGGNVWGQLGIGVTSTTGSNVPVTVLGVP